MRRPWTSIGWAHAVALTLSLACQRDVDRPELVTPRISDADVDALVAYAGCKRVWLEPRPRCLFEPDAPLRLWIDRPRGSEVVVHVDDDDEVWPTEEHVVEGMEGFGLALQLPSGAEVMTVEIPSAGGTWSLPLTLWSKDLRPPLGVSASRDVDRALVLAHREGEQGRHGEAHRRLDEVEDLAARYPKGRADLANYRGVAYWRQNRHHDATAALAEAVAFGIRLHDRELINDAVHVYAGVLAELGYWDAAIEWCDEVLELVRAEPELIPCGRLAKNLSTLGYAHLLLARHRGEPPTRAVELLEQALAKVGSDGECPDPSSVPAIVLSLADAALDRGEPPRALALLATIDIDAAPTADERVRLWDAKLRALDGAGRPLAELEQSLARLEQEVADAGLPEGRWRLALRRGDLLVRQGRLEDAVVEYRGAEAEAQRIAELAAVGVGRESAIALHGQSTERLVGSLAALGRTEQALCAAREAQARRIQGVGRASLTADQRDVVERAIEQYQAATLELDQARAKEHLLPRRDRETLRLEVERNEKVLATLANDILREQSTWRPSCEDLVPRRAGELLLGLHPAGRDWLVFVQDDAGTTMRKLEGGPTRALEDPALGTELLEPHDERIAAARSIRVLASGRAQDLDVHLLSWRGARLIEHVPVTYGAELPRSISKRPPDDEPTALLVADPTETLPKATDEVRAAASWMTARGWTLDVPSADEADRSRVLEGLAHASFFYFAGHGVHELGTAPERRLPPYAGGSQSWPAHLRLEAGTKLEIQDVLMLPSAPEHVALLGCQTGVPGGAGGGMSLALAFLVAGAEQVVATPVQTTEPISLATVVGLLEGMTGSDIDLAEGLRTAQIEMLRRGEDVGRYRVWVR